MDDKVETQIARVKEILEGLKAVEDPVASIWRQVLEALAEGERNCPEDSYFHLQLSPEWLKTLFMDFTLSRACYAGVRALSQMIAEEREDKWVMDAYKLSVEIAVTAAIEDSRAKAEQQNVH